MANFILEGGLIFSALYALASLTSAFAPASVATDIGATAFLESTVFAGFLLATRRTSAVAGQIDPRREFLIFSLLCLALGGAAVLALVAVSDLRVGLWGWLMLEGAVAVPLVVAAWRWTVLHLEVFEGFHERVLILGTGENARNVSRWIAETHGRQYRVLGFADQDDQRRGDILASGSRVITDYASLVDFCQDRVDRVIVALDEKRGVLPIEPLMKLRLCGIEVEDATSFVERTRGKIAVETLLPSWLIFSDGFRASPARAAIKRFSDIVLSLLLLVVSFPLMVIAAILVRLDSPGTVLFSQERVGLNGKTFRLLKFRSMVEDAEKGSGPAWCSKDDPRITRVGKVIRKIRVDELPQLWNVLRGEMSFVGPRPERPHFVEQLRTEIPYFDLRLAVRPGLTGWAQVQYGYGSSVEENLEKLKFDLFYIKNVSFVLDCWIVLKTGKVVLLGSGAR